MKKNIKLVMSLTLGSLALSTTVPTIAKGLGQKTLEEIVVTGKKANGSLTSLSADEARDILANIAGGIGFVEFTDYQDSYVQSLGDTMVFTPGVYADTSAQRESRISVRGSGLNSGFERRGLSVYRDGVPITRASGITEFQEVDPLSVNYIEVYKGANGLRYGANALGGALNIVTPTGSNTESGSNLRVEAGSFDSSRVNVNTAGKTETIDYYAAVTKLDADGFRQHSEVDSVYGFANLGIKLSDNVETRFYLTSLEDRFELAGSISLDDALNNPETAVGGSFVPASLSFLGGPGLFDAIDDDWDRNLTVNRLSNRTAVSFDDWELEVSVWVSSRELDHAITRYAGVIVQDEDEEGVSLRASNERVNDANLIWSVGAIFNQSDNDAQAYRNEFGERGDLSSQDVQTADNHVVYGEVSASLTETVRFIAGAQYLQSERANQHVPLNAFDTVDDTGKLNFDELSPRIGLLWDIGDGQQAYLNISRAYEVPGISDLTAAGVLPFTELDAQQSTTVELGSRGQHESWSWDVSVYSSELENEFIDFTEGFSTYTVNSDSDTSHDGLELGVDWSPIIASLSQRNIAFTWRNVLTVNDFKFDDHSTYDNNSLAGVPDLIYLSEWNLSADNWRLAVNLRHIPNGAYSDYANTERVDGYSLLGMNASLNISDATRLFVSGENLMDEVYVSNVSTVGVSVEGDDVYTPGQGRAVYVGFNYNF